MGVTKNNDSSCKMDNLEENDAPVILRFVIPTGGTKMTVSEDLISAFEMCNEIGLCPSWIKEPEVGKLNPTKMDVFVMDPFSGPAFDKVTDSSKYRCSVVGPSGLLYCLEFTTPVPELSYPMYTVAMKGLVVTSSGLDKPQKDRLKFLIERMAGIYSNSFHDGVTHLVTSTVRSQKYEVAVGLETPVMTKEWVEDVWKVSCKDSVLAIDPRFSTHRFPVLPTHRFPNKEYRRCSGCHFFTYCDEACQKEHWQKVHKAHCKYLSGRKLVDNSQHKVESCMMCIEQKTTCLFELCNSNSPRTICHIEEIMFDMKLSLGVMFDFHGEGKGCKCSLETPCELPFTLGEVSGKYVGMGISAMDQMVAHAIKILKAMYIKNRGLNDETEEILTQLSMYITTYRASLWSDLLIYGVPRGGSAKRHLSERVDNLKVLYGHNNAWWKALAFTVDNIVDMLDQLSSEFKDTHSLQDPRFSAFKRLNDYDRSQLRNMAFVSENNLWPNFMFWPKLTENCLVLLLPDGTRCQTCSASLTGQVRVSQEERDESLPILQPGFGKNGGLMVCCSRNPICFMAISVKHVRVDVQIHKARWTTLEDEQKIFITLSRDCDLCLKGSLFSHRCSACYAAQYCSTDCQKEDLAFHKTVCSFWAKNKFRKIVGAKMQKKISKERVDKL